MVFLTMMLATAVPGGSAAPKKDAPSVPVPPPGYVPDELLQRPLPLRENIGNAHEDVTTESKEAQRYYDQGLSYLESYVWIEAARSFHQALRLDRNIALAHVGLSRAHTGLENPDAATFHLHQALTLATARGGAGPKLSARERSIITIREKQVAALADLSNLTKLEAYRKAIDDALASHLNDPQLWLWRGIASESSAAGKGQYGAASSIAFYERVLEVAPDNASAHHYLVHSYEGVLQTEKALEHGKVYARLASSIPHARHMLAHALRRANKIDEAIEELLRADALERAYYEAERMDPALDWHHEHNLEVLVSVYEQKGQMELAERRVRELATLGPGEAHRAFHRSKLATFLLHRGRYEEALREAQAMTRTDIAPAKAAGHALAGRALLALKRVDDARRELKEAERALDKVPRAPSPLSPRRSAVAAIVKELREDDRLKPGGS